MDFAEKYRGKYSDSITDANQFYHSTMYQDELVWGAVWLYKATGDASYLSKAEQYHAQFNLWGGWAFSWDEKTTGAQILLAQSSTNSTYWDLVDSYFDMWLPGCTGSNCVPYTKGGLAFRMQWGSARYAASSAFVALIYANMVDSSTSHSNFSAKTLWNWAQGQIDYLLGDFGHSFVVGFGNKPPCQAHHEAASCPADPSTSCGWNDFNKNACNPTIVYGALVGGPKDTSDTWNDDRKDYVGNEVACDYNAGFTGALVRLGDRHVPTKGSDTRDRIPNFSHEPPDREVWMRYKREEESKIVEV